MNPNTIPAIALARGGKEGVDDLSLGVQVAVGNGVLSPDRRRARLASWRASVERSTIGAISSNGTAKMSWSTNASR